MEDPWEFIEHKKTDELWVDSEHRNCANCWIEKPLSQFRGKDLPDPKVMVDWCLACRTAHGSTSELARRNKATESLSSALKSKLGMRTLVDSGVDPSRGLAIMRDRFGGEDRIFELIADTLKEGMEDARPDIKLKSATVMLNWVAMVKKLEGEKTDFGELSEEDLFRFSIEPCKFLLLTNDKFRQEVFSDAEVRVAVLAELGVEVLNV